MSEAIELHGYDPAWPKAFAAARADIAPCFAIAPRLMEHIGSTAVPELAAKPVIDIMVLVDHLDQARIALPALAASGFAFRPEASGPHRLFLRKLDGVSGKRSHHLHIHDDANEARRHLLFRDILHDEETRQAYLALKQHLAGRYRDDRLAYVDGKSAFIDAAILRVGGPPRRGAE